MYDVPLYIHLQEELHDVVVQVKALCVDDHGQRPRHLPPDGHRLQEQELSEVAIPLLVKRRQSTLKGFDELLALCSYCCLSYLLFNRFPYRSDTDPMSIM